MNKVQSIGVVVLNHNKESVLLVKHLEGATHKTGIYGIPSGRVEDNESKIEAAVRELKEETGLATQKENLIEYPNNEYEATIERKNNEMVTFIWRVFFCTKYSGELTQSEETEPVWIPIKDIDTLQLLPNVKEAIEEAVNV